MVNGFSENEYRPFSCTLQPPSYGWATRFELELLKYPEDLCRVTIAARTTTPEGWWIPNGSQAYIPTPKPIRAKQVWCGLYCYPAFSLSRSLSLLSINPFCLFPNASARIQYELRLAASDNLKENYTTVVIHVKDVNDNPPVFERPTYRTQITEEDDRNLPKRVLQVEHAISLKSFDPSLFFRICSVHPPPFHLLPSTQHFKFVYLVFVTLWSCHTFIRLLPMSYVLWVQLLLGLKRTHLACIYCYSSQYGMVS